MTDVDECVAPNNDTCPETANCSNTDGSYVCLCWNGYYMVQENGTYCKGTKQMFLIFIWK